ncbi:uncharacterized protein K441DRAFT_599063 [Cenococcum geophilum 1.58]|uniref:Uncharacterized protein n=1 Tax=Cenococcum geophilum 1.58 TaxID=794803 RepID=A0ACC8EK10_9PEZI|nr:hypothetical protein K441DRAFT_599063 [Cenococcum geophilum 1.58]
MVIRTKEWASLQVYSFTGHTEAIRCVLFTGDLTVVSGSKDTALRVWDTGSGACMHTLNGHANTILCLTLRDNLLISGSNNTTVRI